MTNEQAALMLLKLDAILGALAAIEDAIHAKRAASKPKRAR